MPSYNGQAHLNYMGGEDIETIYRRIVRERERMEETTTEADAVEDSPWMQRHASLCEAESACEAVIGFLNGEHEAWHEKHDRKPVDREVFNTP